MSRDSPLSHSSSLDRVLPGRLMYGWKAMYLRASKIEWKKRPSRGFLRRLFERFTEEAMKAIMLSTEETRRIGHNRVGADQILAGLRGTECIAAKVLESMGISPKDVDVVEPVKMAGGIDVIGIMAAEKRSKAMYIRFTDPALHLLEMSYEEARKLGHSYIGSGHLLLGLVSDEGCSAALVLAKLGANASNIRAEVIRIVGENNNETILEPTSYQPSVEDVAKLDEQIRELEKKHSQMEEEMKEARDAQDFEKVRLIVFQKYDVSLEISALEGKRVNLSMWC